LVSRQSIVAKLSGEDLVLAGLILGATFVVAFLLVAQMLTATRSRNRNLFGMAAVGLLVAGAVVTVVLKSQSASAPGREPQTETGIALTEMARISAGLRSRTPVAQPATTVAPVPSLIVGLAERLDADPSDARGWALLAQSYAFVGQLDSAEQALQRAVELGFDEAELRSRVASAERSPHSGAVRVTSVR
jgi:cytochrome c-type biogenesis protein CcmH/NrfG